MVGAGCTAPRPEVTAGQSGAKPAMIALGAADREHFLDGMRLYLDAIQGIVDGLSRNRTAAVASSARRAGMSGLSGASPALALQLPGEFVALSVNTHQEFDALALAAERNASTKELLDKLGTILSNCSACHSTYRLAAKAN